MFVINKDYKNSVSIFANFIMFTRHALEAPIEIQGLLLIHETLGALGYNDFSYTYSAKIYSLANSTLLNTEIKTKLNVTVYLASSEGTSTGVGGGDWRNLVFKIDLNTKLADYLATFNTVSESEKQRQIDFLSTIIINFVPDSFFRGPLENYEMTFLKYETGEDMKCRSGKGIKLNIRESLAIKMLNDPIGLESTFDLIKKILLKEEYGSNAMCLL